MGTLLAVALPLTDLPAPAGLPHLPAPPCVRPAPASPASLSEIGDRVARRIAALLDDEVSRWSAVDIDLAEPLEALRRLVMTGGKRLRPTFCHWAFVGAGGHPDDPLLLDAEAALELLHTFALVHDDVMDGSPRRRGLEAVHVAFARRHAAAGWAGERRRFGEGVAILVGDMAFVYADLLLVDAPRPAIDIFTELRLEVNVGQYLDLLGTARQDSSAAAARRICQYKSGKYTVERPLHLGAALAGRLDELALPLSDYGLPLGEAFQLRDDLLGVFGDCQVTGKPVGEDLREGKPTTLHALAAQRATGRSAHLLHARFGRRDLDDDEVARLQQVFVDTGARAEVEARIDLLVREALAALALAPLTTEARENLADLAVFVGRREH